MNPKSTSGRWLAWLFFALACVLLLWGSIRFGFTTHVEPHFWADMFGRLHGPMTFRFVLQPTMALLAAVPDGIKDAKEGRSAFFWAAWFDPSARTGRLRQGIEATSRILLLGVSMDIIYQWRVFDRFFPVEALIIALVLALIPYFLIRELTWFVAKSRRA